MTQEQRDWTAAFGPGWTQDGPRTLPQVSCAGFAAIWGLLRYLQRASTMVFIAYRIGLGVLLLLLVAWR